MNFNPAHVLSTYSIVAHDPETGQFGVAVETHQMSVGWIVPWLLPGVGAVATQASVNISFGPMALSMLRESLPATHIIDALVASDPGAHRRQVAVIDREGRAAAWTGNNCIPESRHHVGTGYSVQANMMTNDTVIPAMTHVYEKATGDLAQRMLATLSAAQAEDGDIRGMQSAALKVVPGDINKPTWTVDYDLRVDEHENPVEELARLVRLRHAQIIEERGYEALEQNNIEQALAAWAAARAEAPELEELAFWHATTLADKLADTQTAAAILRPVLANDPRRAQWIELIRRLETCGMIERKGAAQELIRAIGE
jgi:uncharacterized Ntn-hydrolase superfamily protein